MHDPDRRPRTPTAAAAASSRGLFPLDLGDLLGRLLPGARLDGSGADGFRAGYELRRRQEANRARLSCPACRPLAGQEQEP
jgi:hypothetical protein